MKQLFTSPLRLLAAAGVLAGTGLAAAYALSTQPAEAPAHAPVLKAAPPSPSEVQMQQTYLQVNGMRLGYGGHYAIQPGKEVYLYNKTEVPEGYEDKMYPFVSHQSYNWSNFHSLATSAIRYSATIVPNSQPEFISPNKSVKFIYTPTEEVVDKQYWLGLNAQTEDIQSVQQGTLYLSSSDADLISMVYVDDKLAETGAVVMQGSKITIAHPTSLPGSDYGLNVTIPDGIIVGEQGWDTHATKTFNTYFTLGGQVGKTYTIAAHAKLRNPETHYADTYFDFTVGAKLDKAPGLELNGVTITPGYTGKAIAIGSKIKLTNSNAYKGAGYRPAIWAQSGANAWTSIEEFAQEGSVKYNDADNTVEFIVGREFEDGCMLDVYWATEDYIESDIEYTSFTFIGAASTKLPEVYVDGVQVQSGCEIMAGSKVEFRNPNEYFLANQLPEVRTYVVPSHKPDADKGTSTARVSFLKPHAWAGTEVDYDIYIGTVEFIAGAPTSDYVTAYIGTEMGWNLSQAQLSHQYAYLEDTFRFKIIPRPVEAPYVIHTFDGSKVESSKNLIKGMELKVVNPNTFKLQETETKTRAYLLTTIGESWNQYAMAAPKTDSATGETTFKVGGDSDKTHTLTLSYYIESGTEDYYIMPANATAFTFTTTNVLPEPTFNIDGRNYQVLAGDAYGIDGVTMVRANFIYGQHEADKSYYFTPNLDWTNNGDASKFYGAYLYGDGYVSSDLVFTRLNGQAPQALKPLEVSIDGMIYKDGTILNPGDVLTFTDPNWYAASEATNGDHHLLIEKYFVSEDITLSDPNWKKVRDGEYTYTIPAPEKVSSSAISLKIPQAVKANATAAFASTTTTITYRSRYPLEPGYVTVDGETLPTGKSYYDGAQVEFVNPNKVYYQTNQNSHIDGEVLSATASYVAAGTFKNENWERTFTLADKNPGSHTIQYIHSGTSADYDPYIIAPAIEPVAFNTLGAIKVSNSYYDDGTVYASGAEIPSGTHLFVDYRYDGLLEDALWHMDIKGQEPSAPCTVPASIMQEGSQNSFAPIGGAMRDKRIVDFVLHAPLSTPVTLVMYCTDADGNLLTNKAEYTFTPVGNKLEQPILMLGGNAVEQDAEIKLGSTITINNPNGPSGNHVTASLTKNGEPFALADFVGYEPQINTSNGSMNLFVADEEAEYVLTMGIEVDEEYTNEMEVPEPVSIAFKTVKNKVTDNWTITVDGESAYSGMFVKPGAEIKITAKGTITNVVTGTRPIIPVISYNGTQISNVEGFDFEIGQGGREDNKNWYILLDEAEDNAKVYGEHVFTFGMTPRQSGMKDEWFEFPEPIALDFCVADEMLDSPYVLVDGEMPDPFKLETEITNWSSIRIVNPNALKNGSGYATSLNITVSGVDNFDLTTIAYDGEINKFDEADDMHGTEFVLVDDTNGTYELVMQCVPTDVTDKRYYCPRSIFRFTVKNYQLRDPRYGVTKTTGYNTLTNVSIATHSADAAVKEYTVHLMTIRFQGGEQLITEKEVTFKDEKYSRDVVSFDYAYGRIVASYITAKGCEKSPLEMYYIQHESFSSYPMQEPIIHVNRQAISVYDPANFIVKPGDVIDFYNPYVFNVGEYQVYNIAEHTLEVEASDPMYQPVLGTPSWIHRDYIGHHVITVPGKDSAPAGAAPRRAARSALGTIKFTSTLTPTAHDYSFNQSEPHTYEFTVDDEAQTGVEEISAEELADAEIYTISGVRVTTVENLAPGFYIIVRGNETSKVLLK